MKVALVTGLVVLILGSACREEPRVESPEKSPPPGTQKRQAFDRLTMSLHLETDEVAPGGTIESQVEVENNSNKAVTDPGCLLSAYRYALVPAGEPQAELWGQVVVDCSGAFKLKPGYMDSYSGPSFRATDKFGDPLPVGDYLAVMELEMRSERFVRPVTITE